MTGCLVEEVVAGGSLGNRPSEIDSMTRILRKSLRG